MDSADIVLDPKKAQKSLETLRVFGADYNGGFLWLFLFWPAYGFVLHLLWEHQVKPGWKGFMLLLVGLGGGLWLTAVAAFYPSRLKKFVKDMHGFVEKQKNDDETEMRRVQNEDAARFTTMQRELSGAIAKAEQEKETAIKKERQMKDELVTKYQEALGTTKQVHEQDVNRLNEGIAQRDIQLKEFHEIVIRCEKEHKEPDLVLREEAMVQKNNPESHPLCKDCWYDKQKRIPLTGCIRGGFCGICTGTFTLSYFGDQWTDDGPQ